MKHRLFTKSAVGMLFAGATLVATSSVFAQPMNSIADSWHNLGNNNRKTTTPNGGSPANKSPATGEICVFCHTPHGGDTSAAVPLWNRTLGAPGDYQRYSSLQTSTFDAEEDDVGSVSIACLSCHDGAQAIDALINAPGSGNYVGVGQTGDRQAWTGGVGMVGADIDPDSSLREGIVQNLGTDLRNDHPISMQYGGGGLAGVDGAIQGTFTLDRDFTSPANNARTITKADGTPYTVSFTAAAAGNPSVNTYFWIERGGESQNPAGRDRSDVIFYTRDFTPQNNGTLAGFQPFVECGSCHDPHNVDNPTFLRVSNGIPSTGPLATMFPDAINDAASGLCLTCHDK